MRKNKKEHGFTILELIITISIIGIISAIAAPPLANIVKKARLTADIRTLQSIQGQIEFYKVEHEGEFPGMGSGEGLTNLNASKVPVGNKTWEVLTEQNYISACDVEDGKLALQTKLKSGGEISVNYDTDKNHLLMVVPISPTNNKEDAGLGKIIEGLKATKDETWCQLVQQEANEDKK